MSEFTHALCDHEQGYCGKGERRRASVTPGPGEGDLRGEHAEVPDWSGHSHNPEHSCWHGCPRFVGVRSDGRPARFEVEAGRLAAERDAAVEQRTLAEQKVARAWDEGYDAAHLMAYRYGHVDSWEDEPDNPYRAALADPEADR